MIVLLLILLGLCLGSFVNALVWRLHAKRNWVSERSECTHCHHILQATDLVPVVSWLLLRGKCRYCHKPIDDSPLIELIVAGLFALSYIVWPMPLQGAGLFVLCCWLLFLVGFAALAVYDIKWFLLPDKIVYPLLALAAVQVLSLSLWFELPWAHALGAVVGALVIGGFFFVLFYISNGKWIGFGDVKLGLVLGLLAGGALEVLLLLFLASTLGMLVALPMVARGKASRKSHLPFGPFLIVATIIVQLWGHTWIDWYTRQLL